MVLAPTVPSLWLPRNPTAPLILSGNEITPYTRRFNKEGDFFNPNELMGKYGLNVQEATQNVIVNSGFESGTTGWSENHGSAAISRITTDYHGGVACCEIVTTSSTGIRTTGNALTSAEVWTFSCYVKQVAGSGSIKIRAYRADFTTVIAETTLTPTGGWDYVKLTFTVPATETVYCMVLSNNGSGMTYRLDDAQLEKQPLATPTVFTNGSAASRSAAQPYINNFDRYFSFVHGWMALLLYMPWGNSNEPLGGAGYPRFLEIGDDSDNRVSGYYDEGANTFAFERRSAGAGSGSSGGALALTAGDLVFIYAAPTPTTMRFSLNGAAFTTIGNTTLPALSSKKLYLLNTIGGTGSIDATLLFAAFGKGDVPASAPAIANRIARYNRIESRPEDLPGHCLAKWPPPDGDISRMLVAA